MSSQIYVLHIGLQSWEVDELMSHTMKLWEKVIEAGIKKEVTAIWVHARKEYHRCNLLFEDAVGKVD